MKLLFLQTLLAALACLCAARSRGLQSPLGDSELSVNQETLKPADPMSNPIINHPNTEQHPSILIGKSMLDFFVRSQPPTCRTKPDTKQSFMDSMKLENSNIPPEESTAILADYLVAQGLGTVDEITAVLEAQRVTMAEFEAGMTPAERSF